MGGGWVIGFWATPHLLLLAESSVGTLKLLRDSRNEASRYVSNHSLTAVLHAGALGPLEEQFLGEWRCVVGELCSTMNIL